MALAGKSSSPFFVTTGVGDDKINSQRKTDLLELSNHDRTKGNKYIIDDDSLGPLVFNIQRMQDDLDELRRFVVDAAELKGTIGTLPIANGGTGITGTDYYPILTKKVTLSQGQMNNIEDPTNAVDLIAAPGSGKIINILWVQTFADIADPTQQLQTNMRANMHVGYDNSGNPFQLGVSTVMYARRFMYNAPTDALTRFFPADRRNGTLPANTKVVISGEDRQAFPNNCFTDVDVYITYQIINA